MSISRLILVPTPLERDTLLSGIPDQTLGPSNRVELCGFGLAVAGVRAAALVEQWQPNEVMLVGIAGTFVAELRVGAAYDFDAIGCFGIGAGSGADFESAAQIGWQHWSGDTPIGDQIDLVERPHRLLLSCAAARRSLADCQHRKLLFPGAVAEDMEAFSVASACRLAGKKLTVLRGISNHAGDRNKQNWRLAESLAATADLLRQLIES